MATIPTDGGNDGTWGALLLLWLLVSHEADGGHDNAQCVDDLSNKILFNETGPIVSRGGFIYTA